MNSFRLRKAAAAFAVAAGALATPFAGTAVASAAAPPPQDEEIITKEVCEIRGNGYVESGDIAGFSCDPTPQGTFLLHWW